MSAEEERYERHVVLKAALHGADETLTWAQAAEMVREDAEATEARRDALAMREAELQPACEHVADADVRSATRITDGGPWSDDASVDLDVRPAAVAGRTDEDDVYRAVACAALAVNHAGKPGAYAVTSLAHDPAHRATVDAARASMLAELAERDAMIEILESYRQLHRQASDGYHRGAAQLIEENKQLRQHILDIDAHATPYGDIPDEPGYVGVYLLTAGALHRALGKIGNTAPKCQAEAQLAEVTRERDEARAKAVDGGEWRTRYFDGPDAPTWNNERMSFHSHQQRVWLGPVEPVIEDGGGADG